MPWTYMYVHWRVQISCVLALMLSGAENYPIQSNAPVNHAALYNVCTMFNA